MGSVGEMMPNSYVKTLDGYEEAALWVGIYCDKASKEHEYAIEVYRKGADCRAGYQF